MSVKWLSRKEVFVRRTYYLDLLDKNTTSFKKGTGKNIALLGSRKSGKTSIVKEHIKNVKDVIPVYIDLEKISLNPENFSIEFIGNIIFHFLKKPLSEYKKFDLSYADCLGYVISKKLNIRFLTGDKQFKDLPNVEFVD